MTYFLDASNLEKYRHYFLTITQHYNAVQRRLELQQGLTPLTILKNSDNLNSNHVKGLSLQLLHSSIAVLLIDTVRYFVLLNIQKIFLP